MSPTPERMRREERESLLNRAIAVLQDDPRVVAAWLFGSLGRGEEDDLSDLDLWVVVDDSRCPEVVAQRRAFVAQIVEPVLRLEAPQNAPANGGYLLVLYPGEYGPQQVDWYWQPQSEARLPQRARLLFDRVGLPESGLPPLVTALGPQTEAERTEEAAKRATFFLAMAPIAGKYIVRGNTRTVLTMLWMLEDALRDVQQLLGTNKPLSASQSAMTPVEPAAQIARLHFLIEALEALLPEIVARGGVPPLDAVPEVKRYLDFVRGCSRATKHEKIEKESQ